MFIITAADACASMRWSVVLRRRSARASLRGRRCDFYVHTCINCAHPANNYGHTLHASERTRARLGISGTRRARPLKLNKYTRCPGESAGGGGGDDGLVARLGNICVFKRTRNYCMLIRNLCPANGFAEHTQLTPDRRRHMPFSGRLAGERLFPCGAFI